MVSSTNLFEPRQLQNISRIAFFAMLHLAKAIHCTKSLMHCVLNDLTTTIKLLTSRFTTQTGIDEPLFCFFGTKSSLTYAYSSLMLL